jgi:hypothetical protein
MEPNQAVQAYPTKPKFEDKVYYHRTPGAKFYHQEGALVMDIAFAGGEFRLSSIPERYRAAVRAELDKVADVPTSHIYTKKAIIDPGEIAAAEDVLKTAEAQFDADRGIKGNPVTEAIALAKAGAPTLTGTMAAAKAAIAAAGAGGNQQKINK